MKKPAELTGPGFQPAASGSSLSGVSASLPWDFLMKTSDGKLNTTSANVFESNLTQGSNWDIPWVQLEKSGGNGQVLDAAVDVLKVASLGHLNLGSF